MSSFFWEGEGKLFIVCPFSKKNNGRKVRGGVIAWVNRGEVETTAPARVLPHELEWRERFIGSFVSFFFPHRVLIKVSL